MRGTGGTTSSSYTQRLADRTFGTLASQRGHLDILRPETRNFDRRTISIATVQIVWLVASSKASRILVKLVLKSARIMHS